MEHGRIQKRSGKGNPALSSTTVRSLHLTLHYAFERAVKEWLIPHNPTDDRITPKVQKVEMKTLLPEDLKSYLDAANSRGMLPMFYLELVSGLRNLLLEAGESSGGSQLHSLGAMLHKIVYHFWRI